jgi:hypothetical protein
MRAENEILIDYLDRQLKPEESTQVETQLSHDKELTGELEYLKLAVDTVRRDAIRERVSAVRQSFQPSAKTSEKSNGAIVRNMYKTGLRVAAVFLLLVGLSVFYKYSFVSNQSIYEKNFREYELTNSRGMNARDAETEAYQNRKWDAVIADYKTQGIKSNRSIFLAAMSEMQQNRFSDAVALFEMIVSNPSDNSFREESEYYLSLAYLMTHDVNKGVQLLQKIKADTSHTYYPMASKISSVDLKILELKK